MIMVFFFFFTWLLIAFSGVPGILFRGGGGFNKLRTNSTIKDKRQREGGSGDGRPLVRGSGGSCNFVQEISFHIVKFS